MQALKNACERCTAYSWLPPPSARHVLMLVWYGHTNDLHHSVNVIYAFVSILLVALDVTLGVCAEDVKIRGCLGSSLLDEIVCLRCAHRLIFHQIRNQNSNAVQHYESQAAQLSYIQRRSLKFDPTTK